LRKDAGSHNDFIQTLQIFFDHGLVLTIRSQEFSIIISSMAKTFNHKSEERRESQIAFVSFRILQLLLSLATAGRVPPVAHPR